MEQTLERFGVRFDVYFSEAELERKGEIAAAVERLREADYAYDADGATWFRSTAFGDDKDRVDRAVERDAHLLRRGLRLHRSTSSHAASITWSTCGAPTTTATWPG